jgi:tetratricopeptide (TPR) repeat protein
MLLDRLTQIDNSKMVFFVGAGISVPAPSRLPNFQQLSQKVIQDIVGNVLEKTEIDFLSQNLRPEVILQIAVEELGPKVLRSLQILTSHRPNANHFFLAEAIRLGNWVFTTNLDNLIEEAGKLMHIKIKRCYEDRHFEEFAKGLSAGGDMPGCLLKLHGTIEEDKPFEERYNTILVALRQVGRGLSEPKQRVLSCFLRSFDFCFMGYSCQDDFSVSPVLLDTDSDTSVFWISYARTPIKSSLSEKDALRSQKEAEENKAPGEKRDWETINVNSFLLRREKALKLVGDSSTFMKDCVCPSFRLDTSLTATVTATEEPDEEYSQWVTGISSYKRNLTAGRLYQSLYDLEKAKRFFGQAGDSADEDEKKAIAQSRLGQIYLIPSTREGDEKAIEAFQKALDILDKLSDPFEAACTRTDLSNALRRRRRFPEALENIEKAKQMFENDILASDKSKDEERNLAYARCLNILGLVHYGLGSDNKSEEYFQSGINLCGKSRSLKQKFGDVDGVAESDNAIALIFIEQAVLPGKSKQEATNLLTNAVRTLEGALKLREKISNFRGCFQHCRNLGLAHTRLSNLASDRGEKEMYTRLVRKDFEDGMSYLSRIRPEPPAGEILECRFRIGELDVQLGDIEDAIRMLVPVESRRKELGDWHNRARTLDLLREAYANLELKKQCVLEILSIYRDVLGSEQKIKEIQDTRVKRTNANDILKRTAKTFEDLGLSELRDDALRVREDLLKAVDQC